MKIVFRSFLAAAALLPLAGAVACGPGPSPGPPGSLTSGPTVGVSTGGASTTGVTTSATSAGSASEATGQSLAPPAPSPTTPPSPTRLPPMAATENNNVLIGVAFFGVQRVDFGAVNPGDQATRSLTVVNLRSDGAPVTVASVALTGAREAGGVYAISADDCSGRSLASRESCVLYVTFAPARALQYSGALHMDLGAAGLTNTELAGTGSASTATPLPASTGPASPNSPGLREQP